MMDYMMDWFPFMGFGSVFSAVISLAVAYLVYKDAENRSMNGLLWGLPILIPWIGILFLILYLILRDSGHRTIANEKAGPERSTATKTMAEELLD
jgi:putative membrane protein